MCDRVELELNAVRFTKLTVTTNSQNGEFNVIPGMTNNGAIVKLVDPLQLFEIGYYPIINKKPFLWISNISP